jgi:hypothetical protein
MVHPDDDETERLRQMQADRSRIEEELAKRSEDEEEQRIHERRSDKADYLRDKLDEQQRSG